MRRLSVSENQLLEEENGRRLLEEWCDGQPLNAAELEVAYRLASEDEQCRS